MYIHTHNNNNNNNDNADNNDNTNTCYHLYKMPMGPMERMYETCFGHASHAGVPRQAASER